MTIICDEEALLGQEMFHQKWSFILDICQFYPPKLEVFVVTYPFRPVGLDYYPKEFFHLVSLVPGYRFNDFLLTKCDYPQSIFCTLFDSTSFSFDSNKRHYGPRFRMEPNLMPSR